MKKRTVALLMAAVLLFGAAVGGTLALLTAKTDSITNTFTAGKVAIQLTETKPGAGERDTIKMVPGTPIEKDPKLTVLADSEACYLYVRITESDALDDYISYGLATGWTQLDGTTDIWWREVAADDEAQTFDIINGNTVTVKSDVTSEMMEAVSRNVDPVVVSLSFIGYAVQKDNAGDAKAAWTTAAFPAP